MNAFPITCPQVEGSTCASCACQKRVARNVRLWPRMIVFCFVFLVWPSAGRCACVCTRRTWKSTSNTRWRTATRSRLVPVRARLVHCPPASGLFNVLRQLFAFYYKSSERGAFIYRLTWLLFKRRRYPLNDVIYVTVLWDERAPTTCILVLNGAASVCVACRSWDIQRRNDGCMYALFSNACKVVQFKVNQSLAHSKRYINLQSQAASSWTFDHPETRKYDVHCNVWRKQGDKRERSELDQEQYNITATLLDD